MKKQWSAVIAVAALTLTAAGAMAQGQPQERGKPQDQSRQTDTDRTQDRDRTTVAPAAGAARAYGYQLMTDAERAEYRAKMRAMKTNEEREVFRLEHHKKMQERAKERGVTLPDSPPPRGMGQGMRQGPGTGGQQRDGQGGKPQPK